MRSVALLLAFALFLSLALSLAGCNGITAIGFNSDLRAVSGTVSFVHLSVSGDGAFITFVTLQTSGSSNQFAFCGDNAGQFPLNTSVTVKFNPGQNCNQIVVVIAG